jgi:nucleoside-diphosphate-sugar epimerase
MKVFITGAHGYIGSSVTRQLVQSGHQVLGLAHHQEAITKLHALGAAAFQGTISNPSTLIEAVNQCDAVISLAFNHDISIDPDFTKFLKSIDEDAEAVRIMGNVLKGKPMVVAAGYSWPGDDDGIRRELEVKRNPSEAVFPRIKTDIEIWKLADQGEKVAIVRLPTTVHSEWDTGMIPNLITCTRWNGEVGYIGEGNNFWASVHRNDASRLFITALEKLGDGSLKSGISLHAIGDEGIPTKVIAESIAKGLGVQAVSVSQEEMTKRAGAVLGMVWGMDIRVSNEKTKAWTGWKPKECGLLEDIKEGGYLTAPESSKFLPEHK